MTPYLVMLKKFNTLREGCFSSKKVEGFDIHKAINDFKESFLVLNMDLGDTVINKVREDFVPTSSTRGKLA